MHIYNRTVKINRYIYIYAFHVQYKYKYKYIYIYTPICAILGLARHQIWEPNSLTRRVVAMEQQWVNLFHILNLMRVNGFREHLWVRFNQLSLGIQNATIFFQITVSNISYHQLGFDLDRGITVGPMMVAEIFGKSTGSCPLRATSCGVHSMFRCGLRGGSQLLGQWIFLSQEFTMMEGAFLRWKLYIYISQGSQLAHILPCSC